MMKIIAKYFLYDNILKNVTHYEITVSFPGDSQDKDKIQEVQYVINNLMKDKLNGYNFLKEFFDMKGEKINLNNQIKEMWTEKSMIIDYSKGDMPNPYTLTYTYNFIGEFKKEYYFDINNKHLLESNKLLNKPMNGGENYEKYKKYKKKYLSLKSQ